MIHIYGLILDNCKYCDDDFVVVFMRFVCADTCNFPKRYAHSILYFILLVCFVYPKVEAPIHLRPWPRSSPSWDSWRGCAWWTRPWSGSVTAEGHTKPPAHFNAVCYQCWWQTRQDRLSKLAFSSRERCINMGIGDDRRGVKLLVQYLCEGLDLLLFFPGELFSLIRDSKWRNFLPHKWL